MEEDMGGVEGKVERGENGGGVGRENVGSGRSEEQPRK